MGELDASNACTRSIIVYNVPCCHFALPITLGGEHLGLDNISALRIAIAGKVGTSFRANLLLQKRCLIGLPGIVNACLLDPCQQAGCFELLAR